MSDIGEGLEIQRAMHRCAPKRKRRGRPRQGERGVCACGVAYVWSATRFGLQWLPETVLVR